MHFQKKVIFLVFTCRCIAVKPAMVLHKKTVRLWMSLQHSTLDKKQYQDNQHVETPSSLSWGKLSYSSIYCQCLKSCTFKYDKIIKPKLTKCPTHVTQVLWVDYSFQTDYIWNLDFFMNLNYIYREKIFP